MQEIHGPDADFACIGQLRKGAAKKQGRIGPDLTYFRPAFFEGEDDSAAVFRSEFGNQPKEVAIMFPFDEPWRVWSYGLEAYTGRGVRVMLVDADTYDIQYWFEPHTGEVIVRNGVSAKTGEVMRWDGETPAYTYTSGKNGELRATLPKLKCRLRVMVPALKRVAYMLVTTGSWNDKKNITRQLNGFFALRGSLKGIPFILRRRPQEILTSRPDGQRFRETKSLISIETTEEWAARLFQEMETAATPHLNDTTVVIGQPVQEPLEDSEAPAVETDPPGPEPNGNRLADIAALDLKDGSFHKAACDHLGFIGADHVVETLTEAMGQGWARFTLRDLWTALEERAPDGGNIPVPLYVANLKLDDNSFHQKVMEVFEFKDPAAVVAFLDEELGDDWAAGQNSIEDLWRLIDVLMKKKTAPETHPELALPDFVAKLRIKDGSFYKKVAEVFGFEKEPSVEDFLDDELGEGWAERHTIPELWMYVDAAYRESSSDDAQAELPGMGEDYDIPF